MRASPALAGKTCARAQGVELASGRLHGAGGRRRCCLGTATRLSPARRGGTEVDAGGLGRHRREVG